MYPNGPFSTIYYTQDMEVTYMSIPDEWIKKLWYIFTMECYLAIEKNEIERPREYHTEWDVR